MMINLAQGIEEEVIYIHFLMAKLFTKVVKVGDMHLQMKYPHRNAVDGVGPKKWQTHYESYKTHIWIPKNRWWIKKYE